MRSRVRDELTLEECYFTGLMKHFHLKHLCLFHRLDGLRVKMKPRCIIKISVGGYMF